MRLSEWRARAPHKDALTPKVRGRRRAGAVDARRRRRPIVLDPVGRRPGVRYVVLAPTDAGLLQVLIRVNVPGEGPRARRR